MFVDFAAEKGAVKFIDLEMLNLIQIPITVMQL